MLWAPTVVVEVLYVAAPLANVTFASAVVPDLNVTVPVGAPVPELGFTLAVNVTTCPKIEGLTLELRVVVVGNPLTVWTSMDEVLLR